MPMTEVDFKKHLDAAESSPKQIAAAVSGLPENVLRYKPSHEKWCVLEVLGHLADVEITVTQDTTTDLGRFESRTVALLNRLATGVRADLGKSAADFPLAMVLEGGSWAAGREIAAERRPDGSAPLAIVSDGTLF